MSYEVIKRLSNWLKIIKNKEWKYNIINKEWKLLSEIYFNRIYDFCEWYARIYVEWKW